MKSILVSIVACVVLVGCKSISIHQAVFDGNIGAVKQHLDAGEEVDAKDDKFVVTFLHWAAAGGQNEIVELLIAKGADVNAKTKFGGSPLHDAAIGGHKEIVGLLIAKGANVNAKGKVGITPLDLAVEYDKTQIAELLRKHGGKTKKELEAAGN